MSKDQITIGKGGTVVEGPEAMKLYRMLSMRGALKLEMIGIRHSRGSVYALVKKEFGLKGTKERVLEQFEALCLEQSRKVPRVDE